MSLQIWLPLMEDFHNQGLANAQFTKYGTFTTNNYGKIGQCQVFNGSNAYLQLNNSSYNFGNSEQFSFAFWCNTAEDLIGLFAIRNSSTVQFTFTAAGIQYRDSKHSSLTTKTFEQPEANVWTHYALVYKTGSWYIYKNGQIKLESIYAAGAKLNANTEVRIGRYQTSSGSNYYNGKLNDFRIYDHALSAKEVEEIAKGLVLHYKLDDAYIEGTHNYMSASQSMPNLKTQVINDVSTSGKYWNQIPIDGLGTYTFSVYIKNTTNKGIKVVLRAQTSSKSDVGDYIQGNLIDSGKEGWSIVTVDLTTITNAGGVSIKTGVWLSSGAINTLTSNPTMGYMQLEKNDHRTPWTLGGTTRAASVIAYDSSGYQNNGTIIGDLTCDDDSPRYSLSINFSALSNYITTPSLALTECSYSLWVKPSTGTDARIIFSDYKSGICFGRSGSYTYCTNTTLDNNNRYARYTIANDNSWQHFVIIRSEEKTITLYKNGQLVNPTTTGSTWSHNNVNYLMIGRRMYSSDSYAYSIKGNIVDFREYATVLTESQIQELYNTSALIDKDGNVYPRELVEK